MPHHDSVPLSTALSDVYSSAALKHQAGRWYQLAERFAQIYGHAPSKVARAPGRVCIIGEHIDYAGLGVMPAAIERDVLMAFSVLPAKEGVSSSPAAPEGKTKVILRNLNEDKYKGTEFVVDMLSKGDDLPMPETHEWSNYFIAGTKVSPSC
jgi:galactokinase